MKGRVLASAAAGLLVALSSAANLDPIVIKGSKFFYKSSGAQFFMRGIAYQQEVAAGGGGSTNTNNDNTDYIDPLANVAACRRDVPLLKELKTNTIRVYAIDPEADHTTCMQLLNDAGIYVIADLSQPFVSINRDDPKWNLELYERYTSVVDELAKYDNVMGFFAGNEVSNQKNNTAASAFVKAAVRDTKAYIKARNYRPIGVGYATNDDADIREDMASFFNCNDPAEAIDFWGYNIYSWCGDSSFQKSGFDVRTKEFAPYSVPVFFAEYGCNEVTPRKFTEVAAIFGPQMAPVWSGGIVYMYFQERNNYGLVEVDDNSLRKLPDFTALSTQMAKATPSSVQINSYKPTNTVARKCPPTGDNWRAPASPLPPTPNEELCNCMMDSLTCVVKSSVSPEDYAELFGTVCGLGKGVCDGIASDPTEAKFGAYGMCADNQKLSFAFNQYAASQRNNPRACDFEGAAEARQARSPSGSCRTLLQQAGAAGTGTVSAGPSSSGSNGSRPSSTRTGAATAITVPAFDFGMLRLGAYICVAMLSGAAMLLL